MPSTSPSGGSQAQINESGERVELTDADAAAVEGSRFANPALVPVPLAKRTWTTYNYLALWVGAGTKYGIPFPVFARAFYGLRGANLPAIMRALVACGWFGIQTWIGGQGVYIILGKLLGSGWINAAQIGGQPWTLWLSFAVFWVIQIAIIWRGMDAVRRFENWAAPAVLVVFLALLVWIVFKVHGFGPLLSQRPQLGWGPRFWRVFAPSLMAMIAFWSTLSLNIPDFTRYSRSQRSQQVGQILGLPTTMTFFSVMAILITSGAEVIYHQTLWDPVQLGTKLSNPVAVIFGLLTVLIATVSVNVAANIVSPSFDFSNAAPKWISFRTGGLITGVLAIAIQPWRLIANPHVYIYTWLGFYGGMMAAVAGVLVAGYWVIHRTQLDLAELYLPHGKYWYTAGWNWKAVVATVVGGLLADGGAWSAPGQGPFPASGLIPIVKGLYDYSWVIGFAAGFLVYLVLAPLAAGRERSGGAALSAARQ